MRAMRARRRRERDGYVVLSCEVRIDRLALALCEEGLLAEWHDGDRSEIAAAFQEMVETWIAATIGPDVTT